MTGDSQRTAQSAALRVGVDEYYSEVLPEDKARFVEEEKKKGRKVIMVGDGINDSPALSASDAGIAISEGAAIAREIADITISENDLYQLVVLKTISNCLMKRIHQNYRQVIGFNLGLILLGVTGVLQPATSALLHNTCLLYTSVRDYFAGRYQELELKGFVPEADIPEEPMYAMVDHRLMVRVLDNLINNAVSYNPPGTRILVAVKREGEMIRLLVADSGCGIPKEMRETLFQPFVTGDEARTGSHGSGLGLAIVKTIVELHGGNIKMCIRDRYLPSLSFTDSPADTLGRAMTKP